MVVQNRGFILKWIFWLQALYTESVWTYIQRCAQGAWENTLMLIIFLPMWTPDEMAACFVLCLSVSPWYMKCEWMERILAMRDMIKQTKE